MEILYDTILPYLLELTGEETAAIRTADIFRTALAIILLGIAGYVNKEKITEKITISIVIFGICAFTYDILTGFSLYHRLFGLGLNVLILALIGVVIYNLRLISEKSLNLLISVGILIPIFPVSAIFPLSLPEFVEPISVFGILMPLDIFAFTIVTNLILVMTLLTLILTIHRAVKYKELNFPEIIFGKKVDISEIHKNKGFIYKIQEKFIFGPSGKQISKYIQWRRNNSKIPTIESLNEADEFYLKEYHKSRGGNINKKILNKQEEIFKSITSEQKVWMTSSISFEKILFITVTTSLIFGNLLIYFGL